MDFLSRNILIGVCGLLINLIQIPFDSSWETNLKIQINSIDEIYGEIWRKIYHPWWTTSRSQLVIITRFHKSKVSGYHFWKIEFKSHFNVFRKNLLCFEKEKKIKDFMKYFKFEWNKKHVGTMDSIKKKRKLQLKHCYWNPLFWSKYIM